MSPKKSCQKSHAVSEVVSSLHRPHAEEESPPTDLSEYRGRTLVFIDYPQVRFKMPLDGSHEEQETDSDGTVVPSPKDEILEVREFQVVSVS